MRYTILLLAVFALGCENKAQKTEPTSNKEFQIDLLFNHDGTSVYRFKDGGRFIYYAVPYKGPAELTEVHEECNPCGKDNSQQCCHDVLTKSVTRN